MPPPLFFPPFSKDTHLFRREYLGDYAMDSSINIHILCLQHSWPLHGDWETAWQQWEESHRFSVLSQHKHVECLGIALLHTLDIHHPSPAREGQATKSSPPISKGKALHREKGVAEGIHTHRWHYRKKPSTHKEIHLCRLPAQLVFNIAVSIVSSSPSVAHSTLWM